MKKTILVFVIVCLAGLMFARGVPYDESYVVYHEEGFDYSDMRAEAAAMMMRDGLNLTEIYVSPTGSDDPANGSEVAPFQTLQYAVDNAANGTSGSPTVIWLEDGVYTGMLTMSGREYITFDGVGSGAVYKPDNWVANEEPYGLEDSNEQRCILTMNCKNIHFEDIEFDFSDVPQTYAKINAISLTESSASFNDCYFHDLSRTDNNSEILISPKTTFGATNVSAENFTPESRALIDITNCEFKDPGRLCVNGGGYVMVNFDNCEAYRTYTDFGYVLDCSRLASTQVTNSTIYGFDMDLGSSGVSAGLLLGAYFTTAVTEEVTSSHLVSNCEMYFNFQGCIMGSDSYWGGSVDPGNVTLVMDFYNNFSHDNYDNGFSLDAGRNDLGFETILRTHDNVYINNGESNSDAGFYAYTRGDGDVSLISKGENIDHNPYGLIVGESNDAYDPAHPTTWNVEMNFCNLDFCTTNGAYATFQDQETIDMTYNYWGNVDISSYLTEDENATINYKPMLAGEVKNYQKVDTNTATEIGPASADLTASITSTPGDDAYLEMYQCNNLSSPIVTTVEGMNDYHRIGMIYGIYETGDVTAGLVFDITNIDDFDAYTNNPVLLKRTVAADSTWGNWTDTGASLVSDSFTLSGITEFGEYTIGCYTIAPEIDENNTTVDPEAGTMSIDWDDVAVTYDIYESADPYAPAANWVLAGDDVASSDAVLSADGMYYRVVGNTGRNMTDPSEIIGGITYSCLANESATSINVIALPLIPAGVTMASDLGEYIGTEKVNTISKWDIYSQSWQSASYMEGLGWGGDFELEAGEAYMVGVLQDCNIVIAGSVPEPREGYLVTGGTTNANFVMLPLNRYGVDTFAELSVDIDGGTHVVNSISYWDNITQGWTSKTWSGSAWLGNDFDIEIGVPYMFFPTEYVAWPTHD